MKIALSGYYGFDNAGDEALLAAITSSIRESAPQAEFVVFSGAPERTSLMHRVKAVYYMNPFKVFWQLLTCDLLISGGGSIFQDVTSARSLPYYISVVALAKLLGKPVIFYAQGVGPINLKISRWLMRLVANRVDMITLRDAESAQLLHSIGVNKPPLKITADPVFYLGVEHIKAGPMPAVEDLEPPVIGVAVRRWQPLKGYQESLAQVLDHLAADGYQILFIPLSWPDDLDESRLVKSLMKHDAAIIEQNLTSGEHLSLISRLEFMIGMRLHALIFAANCGVPFAGISYDPKIDAFLNIFGLAPLESEAKAMLRSVTALLDDPERQEEVKRRAGKLRRQSAENARLAVTLIKRGV